MVNEAFDECVIVAGNEEDGEEDEGEKKEGEEEEGEEEGSTKGVTGIAGHDSGDILGIYPNPAGERIYLSIPSQVNQVKRAGIYNITGTQVRTIEHLVETGKDQVLEINVSDLMKGIYFVRIETLSGSMSKRFGVQ